MNALPWSILGSLLTVRGLVLMLNAQRFKAVRKACAEINARSFASDPGSLSLSPMLLQRLRPDWYTGGWDPFAWFDLKLGGRAMARFLVADQLVHGDSRAALVVSLEPVLLVAAYTDELDCVAMLRFPSKLVGLHSLQVGQRLLTVNRYWGPSQPVAPDLEHGPASLHNYRNFQPLIANFLAQDSHWLAKRTAEIEDAEWQRTVELSQSYLARFGTVARDGRPWHCGQPAPVPLSRS